MVRFLLHGYGDFRHHQTIGDVAWPHFDLLWIHSGRVLIEIEGTEVELNAGTGILIYPQTYFRGTAGFQDDKEMKSSRASAQHFALDRVANPSLLPEPIGRLYGRTEGYEDFAYSDALFPEEIDRTIRWSHEEQTPPIHAMRVAQLTLLLGQLFQNALSPARASASTLRISGVVSWLEKSLDRVIPLEVMAERAEMSVSHFRLEFRKQLGVSPGEFHQRVRMREAARLLSETDTPVKSIAAQVGFRDLPNFYRAFKNQKGIAPGVYRQRHTLSG